MPDSVGGGGFPRNINIGHEHLNLTDGLTYQYQGGVPTNVLNWKIIGGVTNVDPSTVGWGSAQLGAMWYNRQDNVYKYWDGTTIQTIAFGQPTTLYPFRTMIEQNDDFLTGSVTNGSLGTLGWSFGAGTVSYVNNEVQYPGVMRRTTGTATTTAYTFLNMTNQTVISGTLSHDSTYIIKPSNNDANIQYRIGSAFLLNANPTDGWYFEKLLADTNVFCVTRSGGVQTRTDSGILAPTIFTTFRLVKTSELVQFYINNMLIASNTTNIPSALMTLGFQVTNANLVDVNLDIDYVQFAIRGLNR